MKQLNSIEQDTVLVLYIIAENAIHEAILKRFPQCNTDSIGEAVAILSPILCGRAEMHYLTNDAFRRQISQGGGNRGKMAAFFCHWAKSAIGPSTKQLFRYDHEAKKLIKRKVDETILGVHILINALERIKATYDNVEDMAGVTSKEALGQYYKLID